MVFDIIRDNINNIKVDSIIVQKNRANPSLYTEENLRKMGINERQIKSVMYVKEKGKITNKEYQELSLDISRITATRDLKKLVEKNIFKIIGKGKRDLHYILMRQK